MAELKARRKAEADMESAQERFEHMLFFDDEEKVEHIEAKEELEKKLKEHQDALNKAHAERDKHKEEKEEHAEAAQAAHQWLAKHTEARMHAEAQRDAHAKEIAQHVKAREAAVAKEILRVEQKATAETEARLAERILEVE